jgi:thiamine pyrophosphate-dependent acetolactate synthase large subunit-like protein
MTQEVACHRPVTCYQTILRDLTDTRYLIDKALTKALNNRKPVLLEVCRDIPMVPHSSFGTAPPHMTPFSLPRAVADPATLEAAVAAVANFFQGKSRPLIVAGRRVRTCQDALLRFADAVGWGVMTLHDGKGMFPEVRAQKGQQAAQARPLLHSLTVCCTLSHTLALTLSPSF